MQSYQVYCSPTTFHFFPNEMVQKKKKVSLVLNAPSPLFPPSKRFTASLHLVGSPVRPRHFVPSGVDLISLHIHNTLAVDTRSAKKNELSSYCLCQAKQSNTLMHLRCKGVWLAKQPP